MRKILLKFTIVFFAISITSCASSNETVAPENSPSKWSEAQTLYLQEIYASRMAANDVISEDIYIAMANTVCQGFNQGKTSEELLALLSATAEQNGLPINDRKVFGPTVIAAAVAYICPENIVNIPK